MDWRHSLPLSFVLTGLAATAIQGCSGSGAFELNPRAPAAPAALPTASDEPSAEPITSYPPSDCTPALDPGRVELRRLTRTELGLSLAEVLGGVAVDVSALPQEPTSADGFDNNAEVLPSSPELTGAFFRVAQKAVEDALATRREALLGCAAEATKELYYGDPVASWHEGTQVLPVPGEITRSGWLVFEVPASTVTSSFAELVVNASGTPFAGEAPLLDVNVNDVPVRASVSVSSPGEVEVVIPFAFAAGQAHKIGLNFKNPSAAGERKLRVAGVALRRSAASSRCIEEALARFTRRAYRRPSTADEVTSLATLVRASARRGLPLVESFGNALTAALASPSFLLQALEVGRGGLPQGRPLTSLELASRLSYFLWSMPPDETLLALAEADALRESSVLTAQVARMLSDARSAHFVESFAGQWLGTRLLYSGTVVPDPALFAGDWDEPLRAAMREETLALFGHVVKEDRPLRDLLIADYSFLNERLARHYGVGGVVGPNLRRVSLASSPRRGVLTHGSVLTVTSSSQATSPIRRGHWVLDRITCTPPPDPPPGIDPLPPDPGGAKTMRERLAAHRNQPACQGCHSAMDPIGLGLENFDAIGRFRTHDGENLVDASGSLPGKGDFMDHRGLVELLQDDLDYRRCVTRKLMAYALSRPLTQSDACTIVRIADSATGPDKGFAALVTAVVSSDPFRFQRD